MFLLFICSCSQSTTYQVKFNNKIVEDRCYMNGKLVNIIAYGDSNTKDSIIFDDDVVCYHYRDNEYSKDNEWPLSIYYYSSFDESMYQNEIYKEVKSKLLLEDILWSLAAIDSVLCSDNILLADKKEVSRNVNTCNIKYKDINSEIMYKGMFETFNHELLKSLYIHVESGFLSKIIFEGFETRKVVDFEYANGILSMERIQYFERDICIFLEEFSYKEKAT